MYLAGFGIIKSLNFKEDNSKFKLGNFRTVKMSESNEEIRYILKFYYKKGKNATYYVAKQ